MHQKSRLGCPPEEILEDKSAPLRALAEDLRGLIVRTWPEVEERGRRGWGVIGYHLGGYLWFIQPKDDHLRLGFERGVYLEDPEGVLEGDGTQVRYVRLEPGRPIPEQAIVGLMQGAVALAHVPLAVLRKTARGGR